MTDEESLCTCTVSFFVDMSRDVVGSMHDAIASTSGAVDYARWLVSLLANMSACREKTGASVTKTKLSSKDLLTEIDPMCQAIIEKRVKECFPDHKYCLCRALPSSEKNHRDPEHALGGIKRPKPC